ncbi:Crp/Fnr family transcriptional regulator [Novosphingobium sp. RD2P27]|uniref:Crp/Fnr family transcriptional regulator n=1 Tax=Novosphingobium kalidii TaxID=3230299 RepID=A0ABV2D4I3_9SPHN
MPERSELLEALSPEDRNVLISRVTPIRLETGKVLYDAGGVVDHCYFPTGGAVASLQVLFSNGIAVEALMVGNEGALGGIVSNGSTPAYARASVLHGGQFLRISSADFEHAKEASSELRSFFARYADCLLAQVFQSVACNAIHTIEQRAAKWLVAATARIGRHEITITQEQLASVLGVGRSYASRVVQRFKAEGIVRTRRGGIDVLNPALLEQSACTCEHLVKRHFDAVLPSVYPPLETAPASRAM